MMEVIGPVNVIWGIAGAMDTEHITLPFRLCNDTATGFEIQVVLSHRKGDYFLSHHHVYIGFLIYPLAVLHDRRIN